MADQTRQGFAIALDPTVQVPMHERERGRNQMHCHDMELNQVFRCEECGLELKVTHTCKDAGKAGDCHSECKLVCCEKELVLVS